jgi:hypothetical protein
MAIKPVKIKIITTTVDLMHKNSLAFSVDGELDEELLDEVFGDEEIDGKPVVFETEGVVSFEKGLIKIMYDEAAMVGLGRAETVFAFNSDSPTTVSMFKSGNLNAALVFDAIQKRQICLYNSGPFSFEITVRTDMLVNSITYENGGKLTAEYTVEIKGVPAELNRISVKVTPLS